MDSEALITTCIKVCEDHHAVDLHVYDVRGKNILTDYYLICTGNSTTHLHALQQNLDKTLKGVDVLPRSAEGTPESEWILIDYNDVLVHLFSGTSRASYNIEALLDDAQRIFPVDQEAEAEAS